MVKTQIVYCHTWTLFFKNTIPVLIYILQNSLKGRSDVFSTVLKILNTELRSSLTETTASLHSWMTSAAKAGWWTETLLYNWDRHVQYHDSRPNALHPKK